jgi:hypothetical protein
MRNYSRWTAGLLFGALIFLALHAYGQNADPVRIDGQPLIYLKEGMTHGCGIRFIGFRIVGNGVANSWDVSVNLYVDGPAMVKGMSYDFNVDQVGTGAKPRPVPIDNAWVKAPNEAAPQPLSGVHDGQDVGSKIYAILPNSAARLITATLARETIMLGVQRKGDRSDRIAFGQVNLTDAEVKQVDQCLRELLKAMK